MSLASSRRPIWTVRPSGGRTLLGPSLQHGKPTLRRFCRAWLAGAVGVGLLLVIAPSAGQEDREGSAELKLIRGEIGRLQEQLESIRQRSSGLEGRIEEITVELSLQRQRMGEARAAYASAAAEATAAEGRVEELETELAGARRALRGRLSGLYRLGRHGYLRLLLSADPKGELLPALRVARFLASRDRAAVEQFQELGLALEGERDTLLARQREAQSWSQREEERREELTTLRGRQRQLLTQLETERQRLASRTIDLADREHNLAALYDDLGGQASVLSGTPIQQFRGALGWPVEGVITLSFGTRLDPRYKTRVPHNGIEIEPRSGPENSSLARAVYPGKVLYAAPFKGYGPTVVLHHAGRVFSLYAGLSDLKVARNDVVALGQELGPVADRLYFEIRAGNEALDPLDWLR